MSCTVTLAEIPALARCETNPEGNYTLLYIPADDVDTIPAADATTHTITTDITLKSQKRWYELPATRGSIGFNEKLEGESKSKGFKPVISAEVPKDRPIVEAQLNSMSHGDYIFAVKQANGQFKLCGSLDNPYEFEKIDLETKDKNFHYVEAKPQLKNPYKEYFYTGSLPLTPTP